ncbi:hypothetical protein F5Y16DRAFT_189715 [Xylariaceae sp. FL0255]|nr:hypothetical protein F5Y16DRAFT_189715 [Xylariaceae sp. FL0255]
MAFLSENVSGGYCIFNSGQLQDLTRSLLFSSVYRTCDFVCLSLPPVFAHTVCFGCSLAAGLGGEADELRFLSTNGQYAEGYCDVRGRDSRFTLYKTSCVFKACPLYFVGGDGSRKLLFIENEPAREFRLSHTHTNFSPSTRVRRAGRACLAATDFSRPSLIGSPCQLTYLGASRAMWELQASPHITYLVVIDFLSYRQCNVKQSSNWSTTGGCQLTQLNTVQ